MLKKSLNNKFNSDLLWNMASFGLIAVIGILLNPIILKYYGESAVGVYNQVYAIYLLLSQLAVGGIHLSIQVFVPKYSGNKQHSDVVLTSSLIVTTLLSFIVIGVSYLCKDLIAVILNSKDVGVSFQYVIIGLLFFSLNKVLLSFYNGHRYMKAFAIFQLLRFVFMFLCLLVFIKFKLASNYVSAILPVSEFLLFIIVGLYSLTHFTFTLNKRTLKWMKIHFNFGNKALIGNFLMDINTKVDVFILGVFITDAQVGLYAYAASFAEGFMLLPSLFRNNINPIISKIHIKKNNLLMERIVSKSIRSFYKILSPLGLFSIAVFPLLFLIFDIQENKYVIWSIYSILTGAVILTSGYMPFMMIFNQLGKPLFQTQFIFFVFLTNVVFNLLLIPFWGIYGAAVGTAISILMQVYFQKRLVYKATGIKI